MNDQELLSIAQQYGTPLYVYDGNTMIKQYQRLINAFDGMPQLKIQYACKALSNLSILELFKNLGAGLDTVSIQEVQLGLKAGFQPHQIFFTPNGVSIEEIQKVSQMGVQIIIDNLSLLEQFGSIHSNTPVGIRLNPHIMAGGNSKISVGHIDSKFGISIHQFPHIKRIIQITKMKINGVHMHTGSDILDIDVFLKATDILFKHAHEFNDLEFIDFGSGFKVSYYQQDAETNIEELGEKLRQRFETFCHKYGKEVSLVFEPGKFLVSKAGHFLVKVNAIKQTTSTVFAHVDSGFNHLIRPMFYDAYHQIDNISNQDGKSRYYTVVGYICETDTFGSNRKIQEITEGNILAFRNTGAYCYMMSSNYNSRYRPIEVLWYGHQSHLIRKRERFEDLIRHQVPIDWKKSES
ncbi:MAG: diaminopimelate decarboxylase [Flavobacteriaceae bacterium]|nr:diaminopimelate decarboxylase [Flavobacteriaceae bacterium]MCY4216810.1 diaminopimelate decarboxylase [Flavobacteriaceae bacterium]MCY4253863.1 diaminopimelate decarboxylase [Flavobacteriaceae bacterium]